MEKPASQPRKTPRKRKADTGVDFYAFARAGKQLQEDLTDFKERNNALTKANELLSSESRDQKTKLLALETDNQAKEDAIKLLRQDAEKATTRLDAAHDDNAELRDQIDELRENREDMITQIVQKDAELATLRSTEIRVADLNEALERNKILLARTQHMHSQAAGDLVQSRESLGLLRTLVDEPECVFCRESYNEGEYIDCKCKRCSVFYHKTCCRPSVLKCPQCQVPW